MAIFTGKMIINLWILRDTQFSDKSIGKSDVKGCSKDGSISETSRLQRTSTCYSRVKKLKHVETHYDPHISLRLLPRETAFLGSIRSRFQVDTFQKLVEEQTPGGLNEMVQCPSALNRCKVPRNFTNEFVSPWINLFLK